MTGLEHVFDKVRGRGLRVALPESDDPRIREAAKRLRDEELAVPVLIGSVGDVTDALRADGIATAGIDVIDPREGERIEALAAIVASRRVKLTVTMARRLVARPLYFSGALLANDDVQAMVAGVTVPTRRVIEASTMTVGLAERIGTPSSFFIMAFADRPAIIFADCAVNVSPDASTLADIAVASARSRERILGGTSRTALLSFSTLGSGAGDSVDLVREATKRALEKAPELAIAGELQADAAIVAEVARKKGVGGSVAGQANVLVFPDLNSGNISYKLVQRLAGAEAFGPFLQGFAKPVSDLSRGASVTDVVTSAVVSLASTIDT